MSTAEIKDNCKSPHSWNHAQIRYGKRRSTLQTLKYAIGAGFHYYLQGNQHKVLIKRINLRVRHVGSKSKTITSWLRSGCLTSLRLSYLGCRTCHVSPRGNAYEDPTHCLVPARGSRGYSCGIDINWYPTGSLKKQNLPGPQSQNWT